LVLNGVGQIGYDIKQNIILTNTNEDYTEKVDNNQLNGYYGVFTENQGQLGNDNIHFYLNGGGLWFTNSGVWFELSEDINDEQRYLGLNLPAGNSILNDKIRSEKPIHGTPTYPDFDGFDTQESEPIEYKRAVLKQEFVGANDVQPFGSERLRWNSNYFYGKDSSKWHTNVPNYQEIVYENIYEKIDLRYYSSEEGLKYDFILHPGASIEQIKLHYQGAMGLEIDQLGNMHIKTQIFNLVDRNLFIYQDVEGEKKRVDGSFKLYNDFEFGFQIEDEYDLTNDLIIDPVLKYSTFLGGTRDDTIYAVKADSDGFAYLTGKAESSDYPTTSGVFDSSYNGLGDVYITKLKQDGSEPLYSTFVGGSNQGEVGWDLAIDTQGNAYVTGRTQSTDFPTTPGAYADEFQGGLSDVFVFKLNPTGSQLLYSTYVGSPGNDYSRGIAVDASGNAYVGGDTPSSTFPTTSGAYSQIHNGDSDTFVFKLNSGGTNLIYSTFVGGSDMDLGRALAIDPTGNAYITGDTDSSNFPTTIGAYDRSFAGTWDDAFVYKLNPSGSSLVYSTFIGGTDHEAGYSIKADSSGNAYIGGYTYSTNFPTTTGAYDRSYNGDGDIVVFKLNPSGSSLLASTFIGGSDLDVAEGLDIDQYGNMYASGRTTSTDFPTSNGAYDSSHNNNWDIFIIKLSNSCSKLQYSSYLGGSDMDWGMRIAVDPNGNAYTIGFTYSSDFPTTPGSFDTSYNGGDDVVVAKFSLNPKIEIKSISILNLDQITSTVYSCLCPYTFSVVVNNSLSLADLDEVKLVIDPLGNNIQLSWERATGLFSEINDPYDYVYLGHSSLAYNDSNEKWTVDFDITFDWSYPDEKFIDVQAYSTSLNLPITWFNQSNLFRVENDLMFSGELSVKNETGRQLENYSLVHGGDKLTWTGLTPVYEGTTNVHPLNQAFDISIWDQSNNSWTCSPSIGEVFCLETIVNQSTNTHGERYRINITGIPEDSDKTYTLFYLKIDGDNVSFINPLPDNNTWQTNSEVKFGISIEDEGGGGVNRSSILWSHSINDGTSWSPWKSASKLIIANDTVTAKDKADLIDGTENLIRWQAYDTLGNGPGYSNEYMIPVDTTEVTFSNPVPQEIFEETSEDLEVGITIWDNTSGVDSSTIDYAISLDLESYY
jgi:hypothetical protein